MAASSKSENPQNLTALSSVTVIKPTPNLSSPPRVSSNRERYRGNSGNAIATIAFAEIVRYTFQNAAFAGGNQGIIGYDQEWRALAAWLLQQLAHFGLGSITQLPLFVVVWISFGICLAVLRLLETSPWGRVLRAIREDEEAAAALGKNVLTYNAITASALVAACGLFTSSTPVLLMSVILIYADIVAPVSLS